MKQKQLVILLLFAMILIACNNGQQADRQPTPTISRLDPEIMETVQAQATTQYQPPDLSTVETVTETLPLANKTAVTTSELNVTNIDEIDIENEATTSFSTVLALADDTDEPIMVEVVAGALHFRSGPGLDYPTIGAAQQGDQFTVLGMDRGGYWLNVQTDNGAVWLSGKETFSNLLNGSKELLPIITNTVLISNTDKIEGSALKKQSYQPTTKTTLTDQLFILNHSGGELYRLNLDGSKLTNIVGLEDNPTTFHGGVIDPVLSPDGSQIAFTRWDGAEFGALYTITIDGSDERLIMGDIRQPKSPTWSPDGSQLIISFQHGGIASPSEECRHFDRDDRVNVPKNATITERSWGDDNLKICFVPLEDLQWVLRMIDVATGDFIDLPSEQYSYTPTWNPRQAWQVVYQGEKGLVQFDVNQQAQTMLTTDFRDGSPVFSPDGTKLALTYHQHDHWEIYILDLTTGDRHRLTKPPILAKPQYNSAAPTWSPDGSQLAFLTDRTGQWEVWVMNVDGREQQALFTPEIQAELQLQYDGMNERLLNWVGSTPGL